MAALALVVVAVAAVLGGSSPAFGVEADGTAASGSAERVLVVSMPTLTWQDVVNERPPALLGLLGRSAVASMSVRTIGPITRAGEGYTSIGAGNRATVDEVDGGLAFPLGATYEHGLVESVFERRTGCEAAGFASLAVAFPSVVQTNERLLYEADPGALGAALADAGRQVGVVANADRALAAVESDVNREAALAVMDECGRVPIGEVGSALLAADPTAPFGLRFDAGAVTAAFESAWSRADVVLVEMSDLERVDRYREVALSSAMDEARSRAVADADDLLASALDEVDLERDLVMVLAPSAPRGEPNQLTVAAMAGPGVEPGLARSPTTRRDGHVTLPDVAPTVLDALGLDVPEEMTGTPMSSAGDGPRGPGDFEEMADENELAMFRDEVTGPASVAFVVFQILNYGLAVVALVWRPRLRPVAGFFALVTLAQPSLAFLSALVPYEALGITGYVVALFVGGAALAGAALVVARLVPVGDGVGRALVAPLLLVGITAAVLLADVVVGAPLQLNTVFGYSPTVAGRFAGYGNLAFALVALTTIVLVTGIWGTLALASGNGRPKRRRATLLAVGIGLVLVVVADGHPSLGSDVGGVLALVPAFSVVVLLLGGARINPRRAALIVLATAGALVAFAAIDLARPEESRTHLGRLASRLLDGGSALTVITRKVNANISILTSSVWTLLLPVAFAFVAVLVWRQPGLLGRLQERVPGLRACLVGSVVVGALGFALNDSGVAVPAMMLAVLLPYVTFLLVRTAGAP